MKNPRRYLVRSFGLLLLLALPPAVAGDVGEHRPVYSPDGMHVVFMARSGETDGDWELFRMDSDGANRTRVTRHAGWDGYAVWSPDGRKLVFDREDPTAGVKSPWLLDLATGEARALESHDGWMSVCDWSRDGKTLLAFHEVDKRRDLVLLEPSGALRVALTGTEDVNEHDAHFSPDGSRIAYAAESADGSGSRLSIIEIRTQPPFPEVEADALVRSRGRIYGLSWSPDGRSIAYTDTAPSDPEGKDDDAEIYILDVASRTVRKLTDNADWDHMPVWRPDGRALLFSSYRSGTERLYLLDPESGAVTRIWAGGPE